MAAFDDYDQVREADRCMLEINKVIKGGDASSSGAEKQKKKPVTQVCKEDGDAGGFRIGWRLMLVCLMREPTSQQVAKLLSWCWTYVCPDITCLIIIVALQQQRAADKAEKQAAKKEQQEKVDKERSKLLDRVSSRVRRGKGVWLRHVPIGMSVWHST